MTRLEIKNDIEPKSEKDDNEFSDLKELNAFKKPDEPVKEEDFKSEVKTEVFTQKTSDPLQVLFIGIFLGLMIFLQKKYKY